MKKISKLIAVLSLFGCLVAALMYAGGHAGRSAYLAILYAASVAYFLSATASLSRKP